MGSYWTNSDGLRVHFGTRATYENANFGEASAPTGVTKEFSISIRGADFVSNAYTGRTITLPAGVTVREVVAEVTEAFNLNGTTPTLNVGVSGSVATNRLAQLSEAQAEALGVYSLTTSAAGTLAAGTPLAAASTITIGLGGTSPTTTTVGKVVIYVKYVDPQGV
jgi:hypothetical protein